MLLEDMEMELQESREGFRKRCRLSSKGYIRTIEGQRT